MGKKDDVAADVTRLGQTFAKLPWQSLAFGLHPGQLIRNLPSLGDLWNQNHCPGLSSIISIII